MFKHSGKLRIIGGKWRGRKISFSSSRALRPTTDRIRETLFNWLSPYIEGSYCLDLFAGSGALGFEALSRGSAHVTFLDRSMTVINNLQKNATVLNAKNVKLICGEFPAVMRQLKSHNFNIVFLDPPFYQGLINKAASWLEKTKVLSSEAYIYVEAEKNIPFVFPNNWEVYRISGTARIFYGLFLRLKKGGVCFECETD